jgi:hypothetical protein
MKSLLIYHYVFIFKLLIYIYVYLQYLSFIYHKQTCGAVVEAKRFIPSQPSTPYLRMGGKVYSLA